MACVWQIQCFSWPRSNTLLSSQASVIHRMLWGQTSEDRWTPGEAGGREASGSLVSSRLRWHYSLFSRRKLSSKQGHWCLETFSQKSFDRTQSIQNGLSSHKLLKTNIQDRRNIVVITEIIKIKKAKKITTKAPAVWNFLPDPTLVCTMKYAFKLKSPWHLQSEMYRLLQSAQDSWALSTVNTWPRQVVPRV